MRGGTLIVGSVGNNWTTLDPLTTNTSIGPYWSMYEPLFEYRPDGAGKSAVAPKLAVSGNLDDPLRPVIHLRTGVTFHDGTPFDAQAAAWNIEQMRHVPGSTAARTRGAVTGVEVVNADTIRLTLSAPSPSIFVRLSSSAGPGRAMVSPAAVRAHGREWLARNESGTGPFTLKKFVPDTRTDVVAFPGYWDTGADGAKLPYVDGIAYELLRDTSAAMLGLQAGSVDVVAGPTKAMLDQAARSKTVRAVELTTSNSYPGTFGFNATRAPFDDVRVRQAAQLAIDRRTLVKVVYPNSSEPAQLPLWNDSMPGWSEGLDHVYDFDLAKAKRLAGEARLAPGTRATLIYQSREPDATIAQVWKQMWAEIGIDLITTPLEETVFESRLAAGDFDVATWNWGTPLTPDLAAEYLQAGGRQNWVHYDNPAVNDLFAQASGAGGETGQADRYGKALSAVMQDAVYGVVLRQSPYVLQRGAVGGIREIWGGQDITRAYKGQS
ncbi:ABC transporter substrate-binding protein [Amycolatopsis solani]|uniref:ABC transporter substrate-binding protein n=1 Tax=Amycolatopsis solani TaxID=3028615 RepID=UPI0025AECFC4|nr:ABC transporter substrate-binding protein [Amycolatopsis sp. MEP2-6]